VMVRISYRQAYSSAMSYISEKDDPVDEEYRELMKLAEPVWHRRLPR
jgi:hypothetical protein